MYPFNYDYQHVKQQLDERHAQADQHRLARQASLGRPRRAPRRLRLRASALLLAVGGALVGHAEEQAVEMPCPRACAGPGRGNL